MRILDCDFYCYKTSINISHHIIENKFANLLIIYHFSCNKRIDVFSLKYNDEIHSVYALQHIVKASSGLVFTSWIFCTLILLIRICTAPDFELQVIVLTKKGKTCEVSIKINDADNENAAQLQQS